MKSKNGVINNIFNKDGKSLQEIIERFLLIFAYKSYENIEDKNTYKIINDGVK